MLPLKAIQNPHQTLLKAIKQIEQYHYTLNAGTALGLYRDRDFVPDDTDIDVVILTDKDARLDIRKLEGFKEFQFFDNKGLPVQRAFVDQDNGCVFDIYFYYSDLDPYFAVAPYNHDLKIPKHLYRNREILMTQYGNFWVPWPIEEYLEANYGPDWKTPKEDKGIFR